MTVVAAYLIYIAWELFHDQNAPNTSMPPWVAVLFAVLFVGAAGGLLVMAWKLWKKACPTCCSTFRTSRTCSGFPAWSP